MKKIFIYLISLTLSSCGGSFFKAEVTSNITVGLSGTTGHTYKMIEVRGSHYILLDETTDDYLAVNKIKFQESISTKDFIESAEGDDYVTGLEKRINEMHGIEGGELEVRYIGPEYSFELGNNHTKDLEKIGLEFEKNIVSEISSDLVTKYGFSQDRALKLRKLVNSYKQIKNKRALTNREKDVFTKDLTGMTFDKASSVLVEIGYDALVEKASEVNGADPEAIKELLNEVM